MLLICDEVATGFGRTGTLFASEQCGVRPDLLCLGKGLTAGYLAMSATVASGRVYDAFLGDDLGPRTLYHGHSYSGNALAAAVALRHLELIDAGDVLANVRERSDELRGLLDDRIAPLPGGARGPPAGPHGRRRARAADATACAGAGACARPRSQRGVLLRPLGDVVVLMPPLTITSEEMHTDRARARRRDRRGRSRAGGHRVTWPEWADGEAAAIRAAGQWRAPRDLDAAGPEGKLAPDGRPVVSFASNDYLGLTQHPAVVAAAHAALDRWGAGSGSARLIVGSRPVHSELEAALAEWKHAEAAVCFPTGFAANLGVLTTFGGPGVLHLLRRAQPRVDHRRLPARARRRRGLPARRPRRTSTRCCGDADRGAGHRRHRHRVLDGRRRRAGRRRSSRCARAAARCSCSTRPTRCSAPTPDARTTSTRCASARCRRRSARSAGSSPGRGASPTCS